MSPRVPNQPTAFQQESVGPIPVAYTFSASGTKHTLGLRQGQLFVPSQKKQTRGAPHRNHTRVLLYHFGISLVNKKSEIFFK